MKRGKGEIDLVKEKVLKVQSIQGQNFQAKRYLSKDGMQNLHSLLDKMNQESVYPNKDNFFEAMILDKVIIGKDSKIADFRWFTQGRKNVGTMHGESVIGVNKKTAFFVNNETGEVKKMEKPLFSKWTTILKDGENIVKEANENFDNNNIVKKCYVKMPTVEEFENIQAFIRDFKSFVSEMVKEHPISKMLKK